jgi:hypothetical protein
LLLTSKEGIHSFRLLRPAVTGLRKKELGGTINLEVAIPITAVGIHIHVGQY